MQRRTVLSLPAVPVLAGVSGVPMLALAGTTAAPTPTPTGWRPVEGQHYERLATPIATAAGGKVEVVEFFWLGCGHCKAFDPILDAWQEQRRDVVSMRRVHISGRAQVAAHQKLFFALESMGLQEHLRPVVFDLLVQQGKSMNTPQEQAAVLAGAGVDPKRLMETCQSFSVATKCQQANQLQERAGVDGVPTLIVGGRFRTSPSMASRGARLTEEESGRRATAVVDYLLAGPLRA
ncbi:thiol:disulfide interchange protein DsbA/DsbL [Roseateles chitinivorans]|uniref:thiol:disulfide interchange protein DsbA/DsbL n=1 Tax=Roseateles chitinivorans TaxID=2917965 RepID=UPI003D66C2B5